MTVALTVALLGSSDPKPALLTLSGLPAGAVWSIVGTVGDLTWTVPGGSGVSTAGGQVVLVDNRTPMNVAATWKATVNGTLVVATTTVPGPELVLQSLTGQAQVVPDQLELGDFPLEPQIRAALVYPAGRTRPVAYTDVSGDGGTSLSVVTSPEQTAALQALLGSRKGSVVVVRFGDQVRELPRTLIALIAKAPSVSLGQGWRRWTLQLTFLDDPEPSSALAAFTWDYIDALGLTWNEFDALALTWDQLESFDWSTLA